MVTSYTAVIQQHGEWWIGWVEEVPGVNSQGQTREELASIARKPGIGILPQRGRTDQPRRCPGLICARSQVA
jgi:hypothetical protein